LTGGELSSPLRTRAVASITAELLPAADNANSSTAAAERVHQNTIRALLEELGRPVARAVAV
jgi:hypothetical protein